MKSPRPFITIPSARAAITMSVVAVLMGGVFFLLSAPRRPIVTYASKPLDAWFFGSRTNFFQGKTREVAQVAINCLGTNAFPFLLSKLKEHRSNWPFYYNAYRILPAWIQVRLPYPLSGDDIKFVALRHIADMPVVPSPERHRLAECLADCVPNGT